MANRKEQRERELEAEKARLAADKDGKTNPGKPSW